MNQPLTSEHRLDDNGKPAGGTTTGRGITIVWQNGPLAPLVSDNDYSCGCGRSVAWRYSEVHGRALTDNEHAKDAVGYCQHHGPKTLPRDAPNGAFVEGVIAAALDRLEHYQSTEFRCRENALAITKLEEALHWCQHRTAAREARGVEGTHTA